MGSITPKDAFSGIVTSKYLCFEMAYCHTCHMFFFSFYGYISHVAGLKMTAGQRLVSVKTEKMSG